MTSVKSNVFDIIVLGGGAAGLFCAANIKNKSILILEGNKTIGKKIRISGGGRCNFTNLEVTSSNFYSQNPYFTKSALARYKSTEFIQLVKSHKIPFYEKSKGQLFCRESSVSIIKMLEKECLKNNVIIKTSEFILDLKKEEDLYKITTKSKVYQAKKVIIATGGLSMKAIGATDIGYKIAKSFGHKIIETRPALVPLKLSQEQLPFFSIISGVSLPVRIKIKNKEFNDDLLFTHRGLSGPVILQASALWTKGESISINLLPQIDLKEELPKAKKKFGKRKVGNYLSQILVSRLALSILKFSDIDPDQCFGTLSEKTLNLLAKNINELQLTPSGYEGMNKAEVTIGGVDTDFVSSKTMESKLHEHLYFIGEVLDVTGQLGGFNFQWAWSSAYACAKSIA